jgi:hypothetical protein
MLEVMGDDGKKLGKFLSEKFSGLYDECGRILLHLSLFVSAQDTR